MDGVEDESSQSSSADRRISVVEKETGKVLSGEEAPTAAELQAWLQAHPGWEVQTQDDSGDESGDGDSDDEAQSSCMLLFLFLGLEFVIIYDLIIFLY